MLNVLRRLVRYLRAVVVALALVWAPGAAATTMSVTTIMVVATTMGCGGITAASLKADNPHLVQIDMCRRTPDVPEGVHVWVFDQETRTVTTDRDEEKLRVAAKDADFVMQLEPDAPDPDPLRLPDMYRGLPCTVPLWTQNEVDERRARRPAHLVAETVGDGASGSGSSGQTLVDGKISVDHPSAPEAYFWHDGRPGNMPYRFHMGYAAHQLIAQRYRDRHPGNVVFDNYTSIRTIVKTAQGDEGLVNPYEGNLRPDIADLGVPCLFEIKPHGDQNLIEGKQKVQRYLGAINVAMLNGNFFKLGTDYSGQLGVRFKDREGAWNLKWETTAPGVVQYWWRKLDVEDKDKGLAEAYEKAYEEGRWRELTVQEMEQHAYDLHVAVEFMMTNREIAANVRKVMTAPIDTVGTMAEFVLSAHLWSQMTGPRAILPVVQKPTEAVVLTPSGATVVTGKIPAINARSLGSDKAPKPKGPAPASPQKTAPGKTNSGEAHPTAN